MKTLTITMKLPERFIAVCRGLEFDPATYARESLREEMAQFMPSKHCDGVVRVATRGGVADRARKAFRRAA